MALSKNTRARVGYVMMSRLSLRGLVVALNCLGRNKKLILAHAAQWCAKHDDLAALEAVVPTNDTAMLRRIDIVDKPLGCHGYTALCLAAFNGSSRVVRYLIGAGADVTYINSHGEDLKTNLDVGEECAVAAAGENAVFVRERFRVARRHIELRRAYLEHQITRGPVDYTPRLPARIGAALRIWKWWLQVHRLPVHVSSVAVTAQHGHSRCRDHAPGGNGCVRTSGPRYAERKSP